MTKYNNNTLTEKNKKDVIETLKDIHNQIQRRTMYIQEHKLATKAKMLKHTEESINMALKLINFLIPPELHSQFEQLNSLKDATIPLQQFKKRLTGSIKYSATLSEKLNEELKKTVNNESEYKKLKKEYSKNTIITIRNLSWLIISLYFQDQKFKKFKNYNIEVLFQILLLLSKEYHKLVKKYENRLKIDFNNKFKKNSSNTASTRASTNIPYKRDKTFIGLNLPKSNTTHTLPKSI